VVGLRSTFFAAASTELTSEVRQGGPDGRCPTVSADPLPDLALAVLFAALEGRRQREVVGAADWDGFAVEGGPDGPWLTRLPDALRDAVAAASGDELRRLTTGLLGATEYAKADVLSRAALRADLVLLARDARSEGKALYLWISV
jgi:hypothetical protein